MERRIHPQSRTAAARRLTKAGSARRFISRCLILSTALGAYIFYAPAPSKAANVTVNVFYTSPNQTVEGFGASTTWVANDLDAFSPAKQTQILDLLYNNSIPGAGLSWVRVGSFLCNFNPSPGVYDWNYWGIQSQMRWLQRVNAAYGVNKYMVSSWSPPAWMKTNNDMLHGGKLLPQYRQSWANYYVQFIKAYEKEGIPIWGLSFQNEPMAT